MVNPRVRYQSPGHPEPVKGVAVILKEFPAALDEHQIPHESEKEIRRQVRRKSNYQSYMKQYFNKQGSAATSICRRGPGVRCKTCIGVPSVDLPKLDELLNKSMRKI